MGRSFPLPITNIFNDKLVEIEKLSPNLFQAFCKKRKLEMSSSEQPPVLEYLSSEVEGKMKPSLLRSSE